MKALKYQSNLTLAQVQMIIRGLRKCIKSSMVVDDTVRLQKSLVETLQASAKAYNPRKHAHIVLEIRDLHETVADIVTQAARVDLLMLNMKGRGSIERTKELCWIADRMDTIKAQVLYPGLVCRCCRNVGDKRSLLFTGGYCGRPMCNK